MSQREYDLQDEIDFWKEKVVELEKQLSTIQKDYTKLAKELACSLNSGLLPSEIDDGK